MERRVKKATSVEWKDVSRRCYSITKLILLLGSRGLLYNMEDYRAGRKKPAWTSRGRAYHDAFARRADVRDGSGSRDAMRHGARSR